MQKFKFSIGLWSILWIYIASKCVLKSTWIRHIMKTAIIDLVETKYVIIYNFQRID